MFLVLVINYLFLVFGFEGIGFEVIVYWLVLW